LLRIISILAEIRARKGGKKETPGSLQQANRGGGSKFALVKNSIGQGGDT